MPEFDRKAIDEIATKWTEEYLAGPGDAAAFAMAMEGAVGYGYRRGLEAAYEICQAEMRHKDRPILFASDSAWINACKNCAERILALKETPQP